MGLDAQQRWMFKQLLEERAYAAEYAFLQFDAALERLHESASLDRSIFDDPWFYLDAALSQANRLSNLIWPSTDKPATRGRASELRQLLALATNEPPGLRAVRNRFEHLDEYIDNWAATSEEHRFADRIIAPFEMGGRPAAEDTARWLDLATMTLYVFGKSVQLRAVRRDLGELRARAQELR